MEAQPDYTVTSPVTVTREALQSVADEIVELLLRKNADYGDAWQRNGAVGVLVRSLDKALRLETISGREALVVDESAEDTLRDMAGYALLGLLWMTKCGEFSTSTDEGSGE